MSEPVFPLLPYNGTSGHQGAPTSEAAARYLDLNGITAASQRGVWALVTARQRYGATVKEIRDWAPHLGHHGRVSGALSVLHKTGHLARLVEKREHCAVYVLPGFVDGRQTARPARRQPDGEACPVCGRP